MKAALDHGAISWKAIAKKGVTIDGLESEDEDHGMSTPSNPATPATPATPNTPASDETDRSAFSSVSIDSGIESPQGFQIPGGQLQSLKPLQGLIPTPNRPNKQMSTSSKSDHTTKEKVRRERIKDSCDQLRVLLPYIRGRKTDMASILEMCVDYLQIVNTVMPQQLHNQIVDILSKDPTLVPNKDMKPPKGKKNSKAIESPGGSRVSSTVESCNNSPVSQISSGEIVKPRPSVITFQAQDVTKRDYPDAQSVPTKRIRLTGDTPEDTLCFNSVSLESGMSNNSLTTVEDEFGLFSSTPKQNYPAKSAYSDMDAFARTYASPVTEAFTGQMFNTYATVKAQTLERDNYPVYMEPPLYRYYYSSIPQNVVPSPQSRFMAETMDYVNPNAVLSTASYGSNSSGGGRNKLECAEIIDDIGTPNNDDTSVEVAIIENSP